MLVTSKDLDVLGIFYGRKTGRLDVNRNPWMYYAKYQLRNYILKSNYIYAYKITVMIQIE